MVFQLVIISFLLLYAVLIFFYYKWWKALPRWKPEKEVDENIFISVVVPARNEAKHVPALLNAFATQSYPSGNFEVIVVDDFSTDGTAAAVTQSGLENIRVIQSAGTSETSSKKKAITTGIQQARGLLIVCTDADCIPGKRWLETINSFYQSTKATFIAMPVKFKEGKSLLKIFQSLDFITLQGITAASVSANFHTMCNGANLAYTKEAFMNVGGFEGIDKVATGDDMLLMHKIWKKAPDKVLYLKSRETIVTTEPMPSWSELLMQRKRWASKSLVYDDYRIIFVLAFVYVFNCLFPALIVASLFDTDYWRYVFGFWIVKTIIEAPFVSSVARFYGQQHLMVYFPFIQPLHIFYTVLIGLVSQFGKYEWKGRKTK